MEASETSTGIQIPNYYDYQNEIHSEMFSISFFCTFFGVLFIWLVCYGLSAISSFFADLAE